MTTDTDLTMPDMTLSLDAFRMAIQDYDYIEKHNNQAAALEDWSQRLMQASGVIAHYLNESREVPDQIRATLQSIVDDAQRAEVAIRYHIASVRLPELNAGNELMLMRVSADGSQYEVVSAETLFAGWLGSLSIAASQVNESVFRQFVSAADKASWNDHSADKITQTLNRQFVELSEKAMWNAGYQLSGTVYTTGYINNLDGVLDYSLPDGCVMVGLYSYHDSGSDDRRWRIKYRILQRAPFSFSWTGG